MIKQKNAHFLIVDDNPENIQVLGLALSQHECTISIASDGETALKIAEKKHPDLILLDV